MLPYAEDTSRLKAAIHMDYDSLLILNRKLKGEKLNKVEETEIERIVFAIDNKTPLKPTK